MIGQRDPEEGRIEHGDRGAEPTRDQVVHLGRRLRDMWAAKLARDFPVRRFVVNFPEGGCGSLQDYEVSFYQA